MSAPTREEWLNEVRHLQALLHDAVDDDLSCEDICQLVCAGPCVGAPFGPRKVEGDTSDGTCARH